MKVINTSQFVFDFFGREKVLLLLYIIHIFNLFKLLFSY